MDISSAIFYTTNCSSTQLFVHYFEVFYVKASELHVGTNVVREPSRSGGWSRDNM